MLSEFRYIIFKLSDLISNTAYVNITHIHKLKIWETLNNFYNLKEFLRPESLRLLMYTFPPHGPKITAIPPGITSVFQSG